MIVSIAFTFAGPFAKLLFTADCIYRPRWRFFPQPRPCVRQRGRTIIRKETGDTFMRFAKSDSNLSRLGQEMNQGTPTFSKILTCVFVPINTIRFLLFLAAPDRRGPWPGLPEWKGRRTRGHPLSTRF